MDKSSARMMGSGQYVKFGGPGGVPIGFDARKPYRIEEIHDNGVATPKFDIFDRTGFLRRIDSAILSPAEPPFGKAVCETALMDPTTNIYSVIDESPE
ncbi:MAG: hypothetical protein JXC85_04135 [Candidatus Aenigmarchaeota archaeon]|nr:hypothetical protein [Candidatus Aenigmarchaeota archaeon]